MEKRYNCPHCGYGTVVKGEEWEVTYSGPILTCTNCQKEFLKEGCREIAISKVSLDDKLPFSVWYFVLLIAGIVGLLTSVHFGGAVTIYRPKNAIFGIIALAAFFYGVFSGIRKFKKKRAYLKEETQRSQARCADGEYVEKLQALGYKKK